MGGVGSYGGPGHSERGAGGGGYSVGGGAGRRIFFESPINFSVQVYLALQ